MENSVTPINSDAITKISISSFPCFFAGPPQRGEDAEQKVTINHKGLVSFTSREFDGVDDDCGSRGRWQRKTIPGELASDIFDKVAAAFSDAQDFVYATDIGSWVLTITMNDGKALEYKGCLFSEAFDGAEELSDFIRQSLLMPDLWCFDGGCSEEYIYLSVCFEENGKTYYYRTDDDTIIIGDKVVVPVGDSGAERVVDVVFVEHFCDNELPMPLCKVKPIIGRFEFDGMMPPPDDTKKNENSAGKA